jgi:hypothetical protein
MFIDAIESLLAPYGIAGLIVAGLGAIICIVASLGFMSQAIRCFAAGKGENPVSAFVIEWVSPAAVAMILLGAGVVAAGIALKPLLGHSEWLLAYAFVLFLGGAVGAAELVSRYKDRPNRALATAPAIFYISVNALGACGALYLISVFRDRLGFGAEGAAWSTAALVQAVLLAGFSSLLFFRTSLFKLRVGDDDLAIGPSIVLDTLLGAADRAVDRVMAEPRAQFVHKLMGDVSFEKGAAILPAHCLALMQNISSDETQRIVGVVNSLRANNEMPDKIKSLNLGLALLTVVGEEVLQTAVHGLEADLQDSTAWLLQQVAKVMSPVSFERARRVLPVYCLGLWPKPVTDDVQQKLASEMTALGALQDVPDHFKALILGIRLVRLTDGATLQKAVYDLGTSIQIPALPPPGAASAPGTPPAAAQKEATPETKKPATDKPAEMLQPAAKPEEAGRLKLIESPAQDSPQSPVEAPPSQVGGGEKPSRKPAELGEKKTETADAQGPAEPQEPAKNPIGESSADNASEESDRTRRRA